MWLSFLTVENINILGNTLHVTGYTCINHLPVFERKAPAHMVTDRGRNSSAMVRCQV